MLSRTFFNFGLIILLSGTSLSVQAQLDLGRLFQDFWEMINGNEIVDFLEVKIDQGDPDAIRIMEYVNSTDFKMINDHMWESREFINVRSLRMQKRQLIIVLLAASEYSLINTLKNL